MTFVAVIRRQLFWAALLLLTLGSVRAQDVLPTLKVGDVTYTHVTVTMVTATDIYFTSDNGMGNAKLSTLEPALQSYFNYDPAKAAAAQQAHQNSNAQYLQYLQRIITSQAQAAPVPASTNLSTATNSVAPGERTAAEIQADTDAAMARIREIVNQPVDPAAPTPGAHIGRVPYWFGGDPPAKPDFENVDVRKTQEFPYAVFDFVSSDLNRAIAFPADQTESNSMTRYFYTDLSVPKKKLSEDEMTEITKLYRTIGTNEDDLSRLNGQ